MGQCENLSAPFYLSYKSTIKIMPVYSIIVIILKLCKGSKRSVVTLA